MRYSLIISHFHLVDQQDSLCFYFLINPICLPIFYFLRETIYKILEEDNCLSLYNRRVYDLRLSHRFQGSQIQI